MAIVTLDRFTTYARIETGAIDADTAQTAIDAAENTIRERSGRQFDTATSATRLYVPSSPYLVRIHDCHAITSVTDNGTTVAAGDMQYEPVNQLTMAGAYRPYDRINRLSGTWYMDDRGEATVTVVGTFGWNVIPPTIEQAVLILAKDFYGTRDAGGGMDYSWVLDRRADMLEQAVAPFRRVEAWGIA